jgi:fatty acid desaturase
MDSYWKIYDRYYDLQKFLNKHPGGDIALLHGKGRDSTILFEQYHIFNNRHLSVLDNFRISDDKVEIEFNPFHQDIKEMVRDGIGNKTSIKFSYTIFLFLLGLVDIYCWTYYFKGYWSVLPVLPIIHWLFAVNTSHDAGHFALSKKPWMNHLMVFTACPFFYNPLTWYFQHNISHHPFTNIENMDEDLHHGNPYARFSSYQKWTVIHKYQIFFVSMVIFLITCFGESIIYPTRLYLNYLFPTRFKSFETIQNKQFLTKRLLTNSLMNYFTSWFVLLWPFFMSDYSWFKSICFSFIPWFLASLIFIVVTQISHIQENTLDIPPEEKKKMHWSINQVYSTVDYSQESRLVGFLTGGLNTQILHHLIPGVHSSHYPDLYPEFRKICKKHDVKIMENPSFLSSLRCYLKWIYKLQSNNP